MGNNAKKKEAARIHNETMAKRKASIEAERIDRMENPDKYRSSKEYLRHARMFMVVAASLARCAPPSWKKFACRTAVRCFVLAAKQSKTYCLFRTLFQ